MYAFNTPTQHTRTHAIFYILFFSCPCTIYIAPYCKSFAFCCILYVAQCICGVDSCLLPSVWAFLHRASCSWPFTLHWYHACVICFLWHTPATCYWTVVSVVYSFSAALHVPEFPLDVCVLISSCCNAGHAHRFATHELNWKPNLKNRKSKILATLSNIKVATLEY